jgi:hypothetical protein
VTPWRWLVLLALTLVGCVASIPNDPTISADLAAETARAVMALRREQPPAPAPKPGDKCEPCNGTGKLPTDGRVVVPCGACGGTGKVR